MENSIREVALKRLDELDYLKCIFIVLMVCFHLVYIGDLYPYAKQVVYTFHMPGFLLISGYLLNVSKPWRPFLRTMFWFAVPYLVMESAYVTMASLLPIREHIEHLTLGVFLEKIGLHPLGPYWYLHTLMVCGITYYYLFRLHSLKPATRFILTGLVFYLYAEKLGILSFSNALYFLAGALIRQSGFSFTRIFQSSCLSVIAFLLLILFPDNLERSTSGGILIVYFFISSSLFIYPYINYTLCRFFLFLGRNTMPVFLFSPVFTFLCKPLVPYLSFDPTGMLFLLLSLFICIGGSLAIAWMMDRLKVSSLFFGMDKVIRS